MDFCNASRRRWLAGASAWALAGACGPLRAAAVYPQRPVSIIVPAMQGATLDTCMREAARAASPFLQGAAFRISNRPGAAQLHGANAMAALNTADGYELAMSLPAWVNKPLLYDVMYEPLVDFTYVVGVARAPYVLAVRADAPWQDLDAFLAHARRIRGGIRYAVVGYGDAGHLLMEETARQLGSAVTGVTVRTPGEMIQLLVTGQIDVVCDSPAFVPQLADAGLRLLASFGTDSALPRGLTLPTLRAAGLDLDYEAIFGLAGPRGLPGTVVRSLREGFAGGMRLPEYAQALDKLWLLPVPSGSPGLADAMRLRQQHDREWMRRAGLLGVGQGTSG